MLARNVSRVSTAAARTHVRLLHSSRAAAAKAPSSGAGQKGRDPQLSQGHAARSDADGNRSPEDVQSQSARGGREAAASSNPLDAASGQRRETTHRERGAGGNAENIGFQEQIGGQSAAGSGGEAGAREEARAPGVFSAVKQKLGLRTDADDVKQNRGGGRGVTGTGATSRGLHTSALVSAPAATRGQAPDASRQPKEATHGEQNAHLHHKETPGAPDKGKGNAGARPSLPSHRVPQTSSNAPDTPPSAHHQKRALHTSARRGAPVGNPSADPEQMVGGEDGAGAHSADSYFKDVDTTPSSGGSTHKVDSSSGALGDASASGPFSQSGPGEKGADDEYAHVSREAPYDKPVPGSGPERSEKQRYGNMGQWDADKGPETSQPGEGPEGAAAGGRKPEGR